LPIGRIQRFNQERNWGFVRPESEVGPDVFIHGSDLARAGLKNIKVGDPIVFEVGERRGRECVVSCEALKSWQVDGTTA
jgi:cold shock protein